MTPPELCRALLDGSLSAALLTRRRLLLASDGRQTNFAQRGRRSSSRGGHHWTGGDRALLVHKRGNAHGNGSVVPLSADCQWYESLFPGSETTTLGFYL